MPCALRLVLDTNVWLDWLVFSDPAVEGLRAAVQRGHAVVLMNAACREELARVLGYALRPRKAPLSPVEQRAALQCALAHSSEPAPGGAALALPVCADPDDQKFLELARDARAHLLVTRDRALLRLRPRRRDPLPFRIVPPPELAFLFPG